jgi:hypothetical protein
MLTVVLLQVGLDKPLEYKRRPRGCWGLRAGEHQESLEEGVDQLPSG